MFNCEMHDGEQTPSHKNVQVLQDMWDLYMQDPSAQAIEAFFDHPFTEMLGESSKLYPSGSGLGSHALAKLDFAIMIGKYPVHATNILIQTSVQVYSDLKNPYRTPHFNSGGGGGTSKW